MLNINIYSCYKVCYKCEYSYISQEDSTFDDKVFNKGMTENTFIINGGSLIDLLVEKVKDNYFSEFAIKNNIIIIHCFDYNTGETSTYIYEIIGEIIYHEK